MTDNLVEKENDYRNYSIQELIKLIECNNGTFPENELQEITERKDEAIPLLLDILEKVLENPSKIVKQGAYFAPIYAAFLLAQFRNVGAYPIFVEILKLPDELPHDLFGDAISEAGGRILASVCGNDLEPIKELIINEQVDVYVRVIAVGVLAKLAFQGLQPREEIIEFYRRLLTGGVQDKNQFVMSEVVSSCNNLYPEEVMGEIRMAYQQGLVNQDIIELDLVEVTLLCEKEKTLSFYRNDPNQHLITDAVEELKKMAFLDDDIDDSN